MNAKGQQRKMKNMDETPRQPAGISLVEMMIALTIFAVIALALADGLVVSMKSTSSTRKIPTA